MSGYIFATKAHIDNRGKNLLNSNISPTYPYNMVNFGPLAAEIGAPQRISTGFASCFRYCSGVAHRRPTKLCTMFGRLLGWYTIYIFCGSSLSLTEFFEDAEFTLRPSLAFSYGSVTARHSHRGRPPNFAVWYARNGWAAITLGIGPHSSYILRES